LVRIEVWHGQVRRDGLLLLATFLVGGSFALQVGSGSGIETGRVGSTGASGGLLLPAVAFSSGLDPTTRSRRW
jgi:hypothetical protein